MTVEELHQQVAALLDGAGDMSAQFAEVEDKLARWMAGMQAAQGVLSVPADASAGQAAESAVEVPTRQSEPAEGSAEPPRPSKLFSGRVSTDTGPTRGKPAAARALQEDDETVLASLPPQIANAVRIKRRLGNRKPIRELLSEINLEPPAPEPDVKKRTWWRRGND